MYICKEQIPNTLFTFIDSAGAVATGILYQSEAKFPWNPKPAPTPPFSLDELEARQRSQQSRPNSTETPSCTGSLCSSVFTV